MYRPLLLLLYILSSTAANAQFQGTVYVEDSTVKAFKGTTRQYLAWCGGFNNPELNLADLNNDGLNDLIVYEWSLAQVKTFINTGTAGSPHYTYAPRYAANFPLCYDYLRMEDYNNDGIKDLFHKGCCGFVAYRGYYNNNNELAFEYYRALTYSSPFGEINAYTQAGDIPGVADVDGDGDIDFFGYDVNGAILSFYKNCRVENGLPADSIHVCFPQSCWGRFNQFVARTYSLAASNCPTGGLTFCRTNSEYKTTGHPGNVMCFLDIEGDGDMDLMDGNISFTDMQLLLNGRAQLGGRDSITSQDTLWQTGGHQLSQSTWPVPHWLDYDGDGDKDLLFSPHAQNNSENVNTIQLYSNTGSDAAPVFTYQSDTFLTRYLIDAGTAAAPLFYDYNRDGKPDLLIGSDGVYAGTANKLGKLMLYLNEGTPGNPSFSLADADFNSISALNLTGAHPAIGDLDNDGKDDLAIGHTDGTITFFTNTAATAAAQPQWELSQLKLQNTFGDSIDAGVAAAPFIYDINQDGKPDLLIGNQGGTVHYYQNMGGTGVNLAFQTNTLGGMRANPENLFSGFASVFVGRIDQTGQDYILLGNDSGHIRRYTGFQNGNVSTDYELLDDAYSNISTGLRSAPAVADVDGDGLYNLFIGTSLGGLVQYRQSFSVGITDVAGAADACQVFPNPSSGKVTVSWPPAFCNSGALVVSIRNLTGQVLRTAQLSGARLSGEVSLAGLPAGTYLLEGTGAHGPRFVRKIIVMP